MTRVNLVIAAAMMAIVGLPSTFAQAQFSEPGPYQAANPDRDVLNGGQLTPYGREIRGQHYEGVNAAFAAAPPSVAPAAHSRRRHHK
jgi:hypothetical protein